MQQTHITTGSNARWISVTVVPIRLRDCMVVNYKILNSNRDFLVVI